MTQLQRIDAPETPMTLFRLAVESNADPERLGKIMELQERYERNQAAKQYAEALAAFQAECPPIHKGRQASFGNQAAYKFASLDDIMRIIQPLLTKHGLAVGFSAEQTADGSISVECRVRCGLHVEVNRLTLPVPSEMRVNATQKMGAAMSYAKRYALCAALNITVTDEDTDGAGMVQAVTEEQAIQLQDIAGECGGDVGRKCLAWLGVPSFHDCPVARFNEVRDMLKKKLEARR